MLELCQPPEPDTRAPAFKCPSGTTDCHVHVYGPNNIYPVAPTRAFDVPEASPDALRKMLDTLGIDRVVLVQPSTYGTDNRRHLDALTQVGRPARMIAALAPDVSEHELVRLHEAGVRGVRYTIGHKGAVSLAEMPDMAARIKPLGWHVQLHVMNADGGAPLADMEKTLAQLPTDIVIDHIGSVMPEAGLQQPTFQALRRLLDAGKCWVKLSGAYRFSAYSSPYADLMPFAQLLVSEHPNRLLWASDWPHVAFKGTMPNTADVFDQMLAWVPDSDIRNRILVDNPAVLYGF